MQKFLRSLMLVAAMALPFASQAQNTLTVADGTATNAYVPVYGLYVDDFVRCQTIYPANEIEAAATTVGMTGGTITGLSYYLSSSATDSWGTATFVVNIKEVTATTLTAFVDMTDATTVYTGSLDATGSTMDITFTTPYTYQGGNLLIEIYNTLEGTWKSASFYGVSATGASWRGNDGTSVANITGSAQNFIPKTTFTFTGGTQVTCFPVNNLAVSNITSTGATLTWSGNASAYSFYEFDTDTTISSLTDTFAVLNTLLPNTVYTFGVASDCGADGESALRTVSFRTACGAIAQLPQTWTFEADELVGTSNNDALPYCWSRYNSAASYAYYPYSYNSSTYAHSGSRSLYYLSSTSVSYPDTMVAILPALDVVTYPMNGNRMTFWGRMNNTTNQRTVYVGTMSDPTDPTTFVLADSVTVSGTTYNKYAVALTNASANSSYVAFVVFKATGALYIDDVTLEEMPSCFEVSDLAVVDSLTTASSITLSWTDAINSGASYSIYNMADTSLVGSTNLGDSTYTVDNLQPATSYTFGVQANCSAGDATMMTVSGITSCAPMELPFSETFDLTVNNNPCWAGATKLASEVFAGQALTLTTPQWSYISSTRDGLPGGHYYKNVYGTNCKSWMITPEIDLSNASQAVLTFDVALTDYGNAALPDENGDTNTSQAFMVIVSTDGGNTWLEANATKWQNVGGDYTYASLASTTYQTKVIDLEEYLGDTIRIAFYCQSIWSGGDNDLHIDNISVSQSAGVICNAPTGLAVSEVTSHSVVLSWNDPDYNIIYFVEGDSLISAGVVTYLNNTVYLDGLTPATTYTLGVTVLCDDGVESAVSTISFTTACDAMPLPFSENFEASLNNNPCWGGATKLASEVFAGQPLSLSGIAWTYASSTRDGLPAGHYYKNVYGSSIKSWMVTPEIDLSNVANAQLTFDVALTDYNNATLPDLNGDTNTSQAFMVIVSTDGGNSWLEANATKWQNVGGDFTYASLADTLYQTKTIDLSAYAGDTIRIAFYCQSLWTGGDNDLHIDNILVSAADTTATDSVTVTIAVNDATLGTITPNPGVYRVALGGNIVMTATPFDSNTFNGWLAEVDGSPLVTMPMDTFAFYVLPQHIGHDFTFIAQFAPANAAPDSVTFVIATADATMGTTNPAPGTYRYAVGDTATITAVPEAGYRVKFWTLTINAIDSAFTDTAYTTATFSFPIYAILANMTITFTAYFELEPVVVPEATIAADDILYWVGEGSNEVVMAVNWPDTALAWGYRFDGEATIHDMMVEISAADPRFSFNIDNGYLDDILFVDEDGTAYMGPLGENYYWESKVNGSTWNSGLSNPLQDGDFVKWANSAAGVVVDSFYYEGYGWSYSYNYPMAISPVSVPQVEPTTVTITFAVNNATMGSINPSGEQTYTVGDVFTFTATANEGYRLAAWQVMMEGETFTQTEGIMTTVTDTVIAALDGAVITAIFERETGIDDVEGSEAMVYSTDSKIVVKGAENMDVNVYDVNGRCVRTQANATETVEFTMPSAGVYLVKVGEAPAKRVVVVR